MIFTACSNIINPFIVTNDVVISYTFLEVKFSDFMKCSIVCRTFSSFFS